MKKTFLILVMLFLGLYVHAAEKHIYGKITYLGFASDGKLQENFENACKLTIYYGIIPDNDDNDDIIFTIDNATSIPRWKGINNCNLNYLGDEISAKLTVVSLDKTMIEVQPTSLSHWFEDMGNLKYVFHLEYLNTSQVTDMSYMFSGCSSLRCIDISEFQFSGSTNTINMFSGCNSLQYIYIPSSLQNVNSENLFYGIGNRTNPCYIASPETYNFNSDISDSYFIYKSGYLKKCENEPYYVERRYYWPSSGDDNIIIRYDKLRWYVELCSHYTIENHDGYYYYNPYFEDNYRVSAIEPFDENNPIWKNVSNMGFYYTPKIIIDPSFSNYRPKKTAYWFEYICDNYSAYNERGEEYYGRSLQFIEFEGLENINTSEVTDMSFMFSFSSIKGLNFKTLNTSSVTNMTGMFDNTYFKELDLSNFDTSNVTSMSGMFVSFGFGSESCNLDLSHFDTSKVVDMSYMFWCCQTSSLNLKSFDTSNVQYMTSMFEGCNHIDSLDLSNFDTSNVTDMSFMFGAVGDERCSYKYIDVSHFDTHNVTSMAAMFSCCENLASLDVSHFDTHNVINMSAMFYGCKNLASLDVSHFVTSNATSIDEMFYDCQSLTNLDLNHFDTSNVTDITNMFYGCSSLNSIDVSHFETSKVTNMSGIFQNCSSLISLDLSNFDTSNAIYMSNMFSGCSKLKSLDLSTFDTSKATDMNFMFKGCTSLESLDLSHFTIGENTQTAEMMSGCFALNRLLISSTMNCLEPDACLGVGTATSPCEIKAPSGFDFGVSTSGDFFRWKGGCFAITSEEYANISSDGKTITFYCDGKRSSRSGTTYDLQTSGKPDWSSQAATIIKAVFDPSFSFARPVTVRSWFEGMKNLKAIEGIENLNTSEAEYTSYMFQNCSSLETLDLSHFDTSKVKLMGYMFKGCSNLKSVDISNFDSGICTSLNSMFYGCSKLTSLDLSALTINESADSRSMLNGCTVLEELTIPESAGNLNSTAFTTVGTSDAPCIIHAPEGFDFGTDTGNAFQWKGGWFVLHTPATITASVASLSPGNAAQLIVRMNNSAVSSYNGFEMVFCLPEGMSIAKKGNDFDCKLGGRCSGMSVSVSDLGNGIYRIMGYSLSNATISGTEGALLMLSISCPENVPVGSYTGKLEDISLSTTAGTGEEPEDVTFPITVSQYRMGDVDLNGKINVIDVMLVVSHILGDKLNNFHAEYADMDGNGKINVLDVTTIIDVILNSPYMSQQAPERVSHTTHLTQLPASGGVVLALDGTERFTACQMDVRIDGGAMLRGVKLLGGNASSHSVKYSRISDDMWRIVIYSAKGTVFENGTPLLQLLTDSKSSSQQVTIENVELCSELFDSVTPECVEGSATAITEAGTDIQEVPTYTIQGIRIDKPQRGVNIRKGTKVTVK